MKKTTLLTRTFLTCIAALFIHSTSKAQLISLKECMNAYARDTTYFNTLSIRAQYSKDTLYFEGSNFAKVFVNKYNKDNYLLKLTSKNDDENILAFLFENEEQYEQFQRDIIKEKLIAEKSEKKIEGTMEFFYNVYKTDNLVLQFIHSKEHTGSKYTLFITSLGLPIKF